MITRETFQGIEYVLYLPDPFLDQGPLPLITLFRANPEEWFQSRLDDSRGKRNLFIIVTDMISKGFLKPCGFLLPRTCNHQESEFYFATDIVKPELRHSTEPYLTRTVFEDEMLPAIAAKYPVDLNRVSLEGFSLGGYTALSYAFANPGRYVSCGCFDGALLDFEYDNRRVTPDTPSDLCFDVFPYLFGADPQEDLFREKNPLDLVRESNLPRNIFYMMTSDNSPTSNRPRMEKFDEIMKSRGVENGSKDLLINENSRHEWYWVDEYLYRSLPYHSFHLSSANV